MKGFQKERVKGGYLQETFWGNFKGPFPGNLLRVFTREGDHFGLFVPPFGALVLFNRFPPGKPLGGPIPEVRVVPFSRNGGRFPREPFRATLGVWDIFTFGGLLNQG